MPKSEHRIYNIEWKIQARRSGGMGSDIRFMVCSGLSSLCRFIFTAELRDEGVKEVKGEEDMGNLYHCALTFSCRLSPPPSRSLQSVLDFFYSLEGLGTFGTSHLPGEF